MLNRQNRPLAPKRPEIADALALVVVPRISKNEPQKTNRVRNIMLEKFEHYAFERQLESILTLINYSCSQKPINLGRVIVE